jgi:hypothetical protein
MNKQLKYSRIIRQSLLFAFLISGSIGLAQTEENEEDLQESIKKDFVFVGERKLFLQDANKIGSNPEIYESVVEMPSIRYTLIPAKQNAEVEVEPIPPAKVNVEDRLRKLYKGYARAGFGVYTTPLAELYFMDGRSRKGSYSLHAKHLSSAGGVAADDSIPDGFSDNEVHLWGKTFLKKHALEGNFDYERNVLHYYGFDPVLYPQTDIGEDNIEQRYQFITGGAKLKSYHRDSADVNYNVQLDYYNFTDAFDGTENNLDLKAHARRYVNTELYSADFNFIYDKFSFYDLDQRVNTSETNNIISLVPKASTIHNNWKITVGMGLWVETNGDQPFHFYPHGEAQYSLFNDLFIPYLGVTGGLQQNTYRNITNENPFVLTSPEMTNTNRKLELYGGIRGTISKNTSFNARVAQYNYEDFLYFVNDTTYSNTNKFQVLYDDLKVTNLSAEISINQGDKWRIFARGDYFIYSTDMEQEAWNQPNLKITFSGMYNLNDKLVVKADLFTMDKRFGKSLGATESGELQDGGYYKVELDPFIDANLGVEYRYTKRLSAFVKFNNFLAARYAKWNNYNLQRFNAMMGVTYSF